MVNEIAPPADDLHDSHVEITLNGVKTDNFNGTDDVIQEAAKEFAKDNNGRLPTEPSEITPYLQKPIDEARLRKSLEQIAATSPQPAK